MTAERSLQRERVSIASIVIALGLASGIDCSGLQDDHRSPQAAGTSAPSNIRESSKAQERAEFLKRLVADLVEKRPSLASFTKELERHGVHVVQPGEPYSKELRSDYTRFFPRLDGDRVVGGYFG